MCPDYPESLRSTKGRKTEPLCLSYISFSMSLNTTEIDFQDSKMCEKFIAACLLKLVNRQKRKSDKCFVFINKK